MKKKLAGVAGTISVIALALTSSNVASAADLPAESYVAPVTSPTVYDWTGFYGGVHLGYGFGDKDWDRILGAGGAGPASGIVDYDVDGILGGIQAGYNHQIGSFVFGAEGEISLTGIDGSSSNSLSGLPHSSEINWLGSLTGRVGMAFSQMLLYAEGGVAFADEDHQHTSGCCGVLSGDESRIGWLIGGGAEYAVNQQWSIDLEYNYIDFGDEDISLSSAAGTGRFSIDQNLHLLKIGANFRF
jgi:outer membrane immunogenic protein